MSRVRAAAGVVAALAFGGLPAAAAAAPTGLGAESLSANESSLSVPFPFLLPCAGFHGTGPVPFTFSGTASGPYPGSFTETGTVAYSQQRCGPPLQEIPLKAYSATFTIDSSDGTVTGTERMDTPAEVAADSSAGGSGVDIGPVPTGYEATITQPHRTCTVIGTSTATVSQSLGGAWYAGLQDGPFSSPRWLIHCTARG